MRPNLYEPNSGLVATVSLYFLDKYGMQLHNCYTHDSVTPPRPTPCYKVLMHFKIQ
jgi:hypothetical protein